MKPTISIPALLAFGALAFCSTAFAQRSTAQVTNYTDADGTRVTVTSGQPASRSYGPKPSFAQLDTNRDGVIDRNEAKAYIPLYNDFDNLAHHVRGITPRAYARWDQR